MRRRRSRWIWGGRIVAAVVVAGLVAYLSSVGLDKADKLASVFGLVVAVAAMVAPYLLPSLDRSSSKPGSAQSVANTVVGGHLTQLRKVRGVRVRRSPAAGLPPGVPPEGGPVPELGRGQYVNGVWVGGDVTQVDGADGDVSIG